MAAGLYDRGFDSHSHRVCDTNVPLSRGWKDLRPYAFFMPAATRLVGEESYCSERIDRMQRTSRHPIHISAWVIDDTPLLQDTVRSGIVHSVISNAPLKIAPSCSRKQPNVSR